MKNKIAQLIQNLEKKFGEDSFEVSNYSLETALGDKPEIKILYNEGDLTKNYVMFVSDLLKEKFVDVDEKIIKSFGETLKSDPKNFKPSYRTKQSSIKKIDDGVFIHVNLSKTLMENLIIDIVRSAGLVIKFYDKLETKEKQLTQDKLQTLMEECKSMSELIKKEPDAYRQIVRSGLKEKVASTFRAKNKWTHEMVREIALKYNSKVEFIKKEPQAYFMAKKLGSITEITSHMKK